MESLNKFEWSMHKGKYYTPSYTVVEKKKIKTTLEERNLICYLVNCSA